MAIPTRPDRACKEFEIAAGECVHERNRASGFAIADLARAIGFDPHETGPLELVPRAAISSRLAMYHPYEKRTTLADLCSTPLGHSKSTAKRHRARSSSVSHLSNSGAEAGPSVTSPVASYDQGAEECDKDHTTPMELSPIAYDC